MSYDDTHRHRLGANYHQIPVNCPYATHTRNYQHDGPMTVDGNQGLYSVALLVCCYIVGASVVGGAPNYFPNNFSGPVDNPDYAISPITLV